MLYRVNGKAKINYNTEKHWATQPEFAFRSGVSLGALKCFEYFGQISLELLLKFALVLEYLVKFGEVKEMMSDSMDEVLGEKII